MKEVKFYDAISKSADGSFTLEFAVILAKEGDRWVLCKHRGRDTLEFPGGHWECGEEILETAKRELYEETGACRFVLHPVCVYSVTDPESAQPKETFGMLYTAEILAREPELHSEIESVSLVSDDRLKNVHWTYPDIQPDLWREAERRGISIGNYDPRQMTVTDYRAERRNAT